MFAATSKAVVKTLGAQGDLVSNTNANEKLETLTLVKVSKGRFWPVTTYSVIDHTLLDLMDDADVSPELKEEVLMQDFKNLRGSHGGGHAAAGGQASEVQLDLGKLQLTVDRATAFTLKKETVDVGKLRKSCTNKYKKINTKTMDSLKLKESDQLTFVYQRVYNSSPVTFHSHCLKDGSVSATYQSLFTFLLSGINKAETSFTVPEGSTFAYGLMQITTEDGSLGIPPRTTKLTQYNTGWWNMFSDGEEPDSYRVTREISMKGRVLQPLEDLPASTRSDLLKTLRELAGDRRALALLEQTLDQDSTEPRGTPSQAVSGFTDLLEASGASSSQKDAVHLLVSTITTLPDDAPALLTCCRPDVLTLLNQLVDGLKEDGQNRLPDPLPPPLQEDGELRWAAELLCSTTQTLRELSERWDRPELPPGVLLEVLGLAVRGLGLMQPDRLTPAALS